MTQKASVKYLILENTAFTGTRNEKLAKSVIKAPSALTVVTVTVTTSATSNETS